MKPRFSKGQKIYRIHLNVKYEYDSETKTTTYWTKITEEIVESCGQKRMLLYGDSNHLFKQYAPDQRSGYVTFMCSVFHPTLEEAEAERDAYINYHNTHKQGNEKYGWQTIVYKK